MSNYYAEYCFEIPIARSARALTALAESLDGQELDPRVRPSDFPQPAIESMLRRLLSGVFDGCLRTDTVPFSIWSSSEGKSYARFRDENGVNDALIKFVQNILKVEEIPWVIIDVACTSDANDLGDSYGVSIAVLQDEVRYIDPHSAATAWAATHSNRD